MEDNKADVFLIREAIESAGLPASLDVLPDGEAAIHFFDKAEADQSIPCPSLIVVDINLPRRTGADVLRYARGTRRCADIPVVVVTSSNSARDREEMGELGVRAYFRKPSTYEEFMKLGDLLRSILNAPSDDTESH